MANVKDLKAMTKWENWNGQLSPTQKVNTFGQMLDIYKDKIMAALPKHLPADRMMRVYLTAITDNPLVLECEPWSVIKSVIKAAQIGLELGTALNHAYLVPYRDMKKGIKVAQLIPGYQGLIDLARRSGQILLIEARVVHDKDEFRIDYAAIPPFSHRPSLDKDCGGLRGVYAVARVRGAEQYPKFEWMPKHEIEAIRKGSKMSDRGPWKDHYEEMAKKTAIRRLSKTLPMSIELAEGLQLAAAAEAGEVHAVEVGIDEFDAIGRPEQPKVTEQVAKRLESRAAQKAAELDAEPEPAPAEGGGFDPETGEVWPDQGAGATPEPEPGGATPEPEPGEDMAPLTLDQQKTIAQACRKAQISAPALFAWLADQYGVSKLEDAPQAIYATLRGDIENHADRIREAAAQ